MSNLKETTSKQYSIKFMDTMAHVHVVDYEKTIMIWVGTSSGVVHEYIMALNVPDVGSTASRLMGSDENDHALGVAKRLAHKLNKPTLLLWGLVDCLPDFLIYTERQLHTILTSDY